MDSQETTQHQFLVRGPIYKVIWSYGIPCALITLINTLYNIVDQIFIGNKVGPIGNAATNVIFPLTTIALAFGLLIGSGCAALFSILSGQGNKKGAARCMGNSIVLLFAEGILYMILSLVLLPQIVVWFGSTNTVYPYAMSYGRIICYGLPCYMISIGFSNILRADGRPAMATVSTVIGCILNCILDPLFLFTFNWGVAGAAWATIIGQTASLIFSTVMIFKTRTVHLVKSDFSLNGKLCLKIAGGGLTEFALNMCVTILFIVNNNLLTYYGALSEFGADIPLATYGIMMKLSHVVSALSTGMGQGAQPLIGYCYGSRNFKRVKQAIRFSVLQGLVIGAVVWAICMVFARQILLLFGTGDALYVEFGTAMIRIYLSLIFLNSIQITVSNVFMSIGKAYAGALLTIARNLVLCTLSGLILCPLIGVQGVMFEGPIADGGSAIIAMIMLAYEWKKLSALQKTEELPSRMAAEPAV